MHYLSGWHQIQREEKTYFIKKTHILGVVKFVVSDLVHVWLTETKDDEIFNLFETLNPLIEFSDGTIIHKMIDNSLVEKGEEQPLSSVELVVLDDNSLELKFKMVMSRLLLKLDINVKKASPQTFYKEVTLPILQITEELYTRQNFLCLSLEKKDIEINQFKLEGATLMRTAVKTNPFSKTDFLSKWHSQNSLTSATGVENVISFLNLLQNCNLSVNETKSVDDLPSCSKSKPLKQTKDEPCSQINSKVQSGSEGTVALHTSSQNGTSKLNKKKRPKLNL